MKKKKQTFALTLIFSLFFIWAISSNLLPTMIRQLMKTFELSAFQASLTEASYWIAYFIFPIPIAMFMKRYSYKAGIIVGLSIAALGGLLFFPAAIIQEYWAYLAIFFIIATGMCFLETAANPYVTVLGDPATAPRRLNLAQSFNGLGAFIAAMFLSKLVLSGHDYTRETIPASYPGGWEGFVQFETNAMKTPYLVLAIVLILIAVVFIFSHLPKIQEGGQEEGNAKGEKLIDFSVLKSSHLRWGVIAQFFYNGGQTAINAMFLIYCCKYVGLSEGTATTYFGLYMLAFLLGRWIGTLLMVRFKPQNMLVVYALANIFLCGVIMAFGGMIGLYAMLGVSFFMSIMYPTQFSLALKGLGSKTKSGSAFLVMAIVGNVVLPPLTGHLMDINEQFYHLAYFVPLICFIFCAYYGWKGYKVID
ncbi:FHS family L-fucose permease-like MFS transporter [Parabacteroides sp. PFB2-10]|uniref:L-fucose:H+ symporter permease n=1 Tax=Parabacteroides sp. PFB2-10 TaxID=1742405 RepID=UPI002475BF88|nr:L-fucose:H+ symporter permease [Parabacteroides sp. PFB2-10]MDH6313608.1 FHS family L-fucose permease-like MFS transporter [Parabacteroides sp. PFB2-10]